MAAQTRHATVDAAFLKEIESWRSRWPAISPCATPPWPPRPQLRRADDHRPHHLPADRRRPRHRGLRAARRPARTASESTPACATSTARPTRATTRASSTSPGARTGEEDPDTLTPRLDIDDKTLEAIFRNLYYPDSPYEFSVFPVDVLGQVYEQFLGKVIDLAGTAASTIEEKPEVRKAGGVYYTPNYIVDYIVAQTVGKLLEGNKPGPAAPQQAEDPRPGLRLRLVPDRGLRLPARLAPRPVHRGWAGEAPQGTVPGAGRAVAADDRREEAHPAQQHLRRGHRPPGRRGHQALAAAEGAGRRVGRGADQAARRCSAERVLPDLSDNIKCGNSLIGPDFYDTGQMSFLDPEEHYRINVFDWKAAFPDVFGGGNPGFDAVIGNPPYDVMEKERGTASWPHMALSDYARSKVEYANALGGKLNLFRFFLIRSLALLSEGARFGMIVPLAILADISCAKTRRAFMLATRKLEADCFPQKDNPKRRIFL